MKSLKTYSNCLLVIVILFGTISCDIFEQRDRTIDTSDPQVAFFPLNRSVGGDGTTTIEVQLIGEQRSSALPLSVSVVSGETTAQQGTHYSLPSNSVTISADSSTAGFDIDYTGSNVTGNDVVLTLELQGTDQVRAAPNLRRHTLTISN